MKKPIVSALGPLALLFSLTLGAQSEESVQDQKKQELHEQKVADAKAREMDGLREGKADSMEYTLNPSSVELMVEMDPGNYGFRTRNHRMTLAADVDLLFRGRAMLRYDYRFFNHLSFGVMGGVDWSSMSLYSRLRDQLGAATPKQFAFLGGLSAKWRLSEWYMNSSFFLEPSLLFGRLWQELGSVQKDKFWRLKPGIFAGWERVADSGFSLSVRVGAEFPLDFGGEGRGNPIKEIAEPLVVIGLGFAI